MDYLDVLDEHDVLDVADELTGKPSQEVLVDRSEMEWKAIVIEMAMEIAKLRGEGKYFLDL